VPKAMPQQSDTAPTLALDQRQRANTSSQFPIGSLGRKGDILLTEAAEAPQLLEISRLRPSQVPSVLRFGKFALDVKLLKFSQSQYTSYQMLYNGAVE